MIRSIAFSALLAAGFAMSGLPALAQGTSSGSACSSDDPFCNSRPGGVPGTSGRDLPEDPGYYRPDPRPRPPHRPPNFPGPPPGYYRPPPPPDFYYSDRISCRQAKNIVRNEGFHQVRALDCEGRQYQFRASYKGRPVIVVISSRSGRILDVEWL